MSDNKDITHKNVAGMYLKPVSDKINELLKWGVFDKYILETMAVNRDPRDTLPEFNLQYKKMAPWIILITMAVVGGIFDNFWVAACIPVISVLIYFSRKKDLQDAMQVIGRMAYIKKSIRECIGHLHKDNQNAPGYDTNYVQPLLVDYFKKRRHLTGAEFFNVYLELCNACGPSVDDTTIKKYEFAEMLGIETIEDIDDDEDEEYGLEILDDSEHKESDLLNAVEQFKSDMERQRVKKIKDDKNKESAKEIKSSLSKATAAISSVNASDKPVSKPNEKTVVKPTKENNVPVETVKPQKTEVKDILSDKETDKKSEPSIDLPSEPTENTANKTEHKTVKPVVEQVVEPENKSEIAELESLIDKSDIQIDLDDDFELPNDDEYDLPDNEDGEPEDLNDENLDMLISEFNHEDK